MIQISEQWSKNQQNRDIYLWMQLACFAFLLALFQLLLQSTEVVQDWEHRFQTLHYSMRASFQEASPLLPIVLVKIDDSSLDLLDSRSPLHRGKLAQWIEEISAQEPLLIAMNILLDRPAEEMQDLELTKALRNSGVVILRDEAASPVLDRFSIAALGQGSWQVRVDSSGTAQSICNQNKACRAGKLFHQQIWQNLQGKRGFSNPIPLPEQSWLRINYSSPKDSFLQIKVQELSRLPKKALQGKIVLLGTAFPDLYPTYRTPYGGTAQSIQEIELVAELLQTLMTKGVFKQVPTSLFSLIFFLILLLIAWAFSYYGLFRGVLYSMTGLFAGWLLISIAFAFGNWDIPFILPAGMICLFCLAASLGKSVQDKIQLLSTELELKQSKIDFLTNELHSHHLFNEFSRISVLIRQNPKVAREYLVEFAEMLRSSLKYSDQRRVPLVEQINYLRAYIRQQELIFKGKLDFTFVIDGQPEASQAAWHLFFPLLENAVKYTEPLLKMDPQKVATIQIQLNLTVDRIEFLVLNPFISGEKTASSGTGLKNLRHRLEMLYPGKGGSLELKEEAGQWIARLQVPTA